jgi:hypothetical protein
MVCRCMYTMEDGRVVVDCIEGIIFRGVMRRRRSSGKLCRW